MSDSFAIKRKVDAFLQEAGMSEHNIDFAGQVSKFIAEMDAGLRGAESSLMMLPSYLSAPRCLPRSERVLVLDAGGTNLRVACVRFDDWGRPVVEEFQKYLMPGVGGGPISHKAFFRKLADYMKPIAERSDRVGFCFSFPCEILESGDGKILAFNKEVAIEGAEGAIIGGELNEALEDYGFGGKRVKVINDTLACNLGGMAEHGDREFSGHIGFILGTGTNMCYFENPELITKINYSGDGRRMAVNLEGGGYGCFPQGRFDAELDQSTINPGDHKFEKMVSGGYFGQLLLLTLRGMSGAGIFGSACSDSFERLTEISSEQADEFLNYPRGANELAQACVSDADRIALYHVIHGLYRRSGKLVAIALFALMKKDGRLGDPTRPIGIVAEGSMFCQSKLMRFCLERQLAPRCAEGGMYYEFLHATDTTLIGAATAALL